MVKKKSGEKDTRWCAYCQKTKHTRETRWKLNGKRPFHDKRGKEPFKKAFQGTIADDLETMTTFESSNYSPFSKDQLKLLYEIQGQWIII